MAHSFKHTDQGKAIFQTMQPKYTTLWKKLKKSNTTFSVDRL